MNRKYYLIFLFLIFSCGKQAEESGNPSNEILLHDSSEATNKVIEEEVPIVKDKEVDSNVGSTQETDAWLTPQFLTADFNGDNYLDTAVAVIIDGKKGIKVRHGQTGKEFVLGAGNKFGNGGEDFGWANTWSLVTDKKTTEVTFMEDGDVDGSREVILDNVAFYIGTEDYGGATIVWKDGEYRWIHQAD